MNPEANPHELIIWVQTVITLAAIAIASWLVRRWVTDTDSRMKKKMETLENRLAADEEAYVTRELHSLLCSNSGLQMREFFNEQMKQLKDEVFAELRAIKALIIKSNGDSEKN